MTTIALSLLLNALVLFFVTRPLRALVLIVTYAAVAFATLTLMARFDNDVTSTLFGIVMFLGPVTLVVIEFFRHEKQLAGRTVFVRVEDENAPHFLGTNDMERLRNEVEIAIFHRVDRIALITKCCYAMAALDSAMAALDRDWIGVAFALVAAGVAYTCRAHESRVFAIGYVVVGAVATWHGLRYDMAALLSAPLFLGGSLVVMTFKLARLRRMRERMLYVEAEHLKD